MIENVTARGRRSYQEDAGFISYFGEGVLFGVFDGHGGWECSKLCSTEFSILFKQELENLGPKNPSLLLKNTFAKIVELTANIVPGCTASVVFIPAERKKVHVAVLGDSPVVIGTSQGISVSPEHNARTNQIDREAAEAKGAMYFQGYLGMPTQNGGLQLTRALGDREYSFLNREPEIYSLTAKDFVLVASDGAFDPGHENTHLEIKRVVRKIRKGASALDIVERALAVPTYDNVTVLLWRP